MTVREIDRQGCALVDSLLSAESSSEQWANNGQAMGKPIASPLPGQAMGKHVHHCTKRDIANSSCFTSTMFDNAQLMLRIQDMPSWKEQSTECGRCVCMHAGRQAQQFDQQLGLYLRSSWECTDDRLGEPPDEEIL